jgi:hypothetical protein
VLSWKFYQKRKRALLCDICCDARSQTPRFGGFLIVIRRALAVVLLLISGAVLADDYPTVDRVQFVLECMKNHEGKYEYVYKCSCVIDAIAKKMPYDTFVEASSIARYATMGGERMGVFRDSDEMRALARKWKTVEAEANTACLVE